MKEVVSRWSVRGQARHSRLRAFAHRGEVALHHLRADDVRVRLPCLARLHRRAGRAERGCMTAAKISSRRPRYWANRR